MGLTKAFPAEGPDAVMSSAAPDCPPTPPDPDPRRPALPHPGRLPRWRPALPRCRLAADQPALVAVPEPTSTCSQRPRRLRRTVEFADMTRTRAQPGPDHPEHPPLRRRPSRAAGPVRRRADLAGPLSRRDLRGHPARGDAQHRVRRRRDRHPLPVRRQPTSSPPRSRTRGGPTRPSSTTTSGGPARTTPIRTGSTPATTRSCPSRRTTSRPSRSAPTTCRGRAIRPALRR